MLPIQVCPQRTVRPMPLAHLHLGQYRLNDRIPEGPWSEGPSAEGPFADVAGTPTLHARLDGSCILLVEDEAVVAMDIRFALTDFGAHVLGPAASLADALALAHGAPRIDGAILDIDLDGEDVFGLAELLVSRGVPFLFHTGGPLIEGLDARFPDAGLLRKPVAVEDLLWSLVERMGRGVSSSA